jgi:signal transduction histidine kinase/ligand-binding sensor domain-containing protein
VKKRIAKRLFLYLVVLVAPCWASADGVRQPAYADLYHTPWEINDGTPPDIWAIDQSPNGFLWLATGAGLYRFDGVRFERYSPPEGQHFPSSDMTALKILPTGETWIGYYLSGVSLLSHDRLQNFGSKEGLPEGIVYDFAQDKAGVLWVAVAGGLARYVDRRWERTGESWSYSAPDARWVLADTRGNVWAAAEDSIFKLQPGAHEFERFDVPIPSGGVLAEAPDGSIWLSDSIGGTRPLTNRSGDVLPSIGRTPAWADLKAHRMLFTHDGYLWITDQVNGGVDRIAPREQEPTRSPALESFTERDGLVSNATTPIFEDREGNVWIGTSFGLNQFRHRNVRALRLVSSDEPSGLFGMAEDGKGFVVIAAGGKLLRTDGETTHEIASGLPRTTAAALGTDGDLLLLTKSGLWRARDKKLDPLPLPEALPDLADILALAVDGDGAPWISLARHGVYKLANSIWMRVGLPTPGVPNVLYRDVEGRMWMGYPQDRVVAYFRDEVREYSLKDGLSVGNVTSIYRDGEDVYIAGETGFAKLRSGSVKSLSQAQGATFRSVTGMAATPDGSLWLNGASGVLRIGKAELQESFEDVLHQPDFALFDTLDGLPGAAAQGNSVATVATAANGTLWFDMTQGVGWLNPASIRRNAVPPSVSIDSFKVDDKVFAAADGLSLPQRTTSLRIDFTAASLTIPSRVRFRFKLEGTDTDWTDAGNRREVFYTNLGPGSYRFRVIAANEDGVWNTEGAALDFTIAPTVFQTRAFLIACVLTVVLLIWMLYLWRLRQVGERVRERIEERHRERDRIARELHDTLLQGFQGSIYRVQAAVERMSADAPSRIAIETALDLADQALVDGRRRVAGLRADAHGEGDLSTAFARIGNDFVLEFAPTLRILIEGTPRTLQFIVRDDIYQIGREAIINAFRHAQASTIEVEIIYGNDDFCVRIRDDGCGIDPAIISAGGRPGHWGLAGMRERARSIGAVFNIWGGASAGTEMEVRLPAAHAYVNVTKSTWKNALRSLIERSRAQGHYPS